MNQIQKAESMEDALRWILETPHHRGWWTSRHFYLAGEFSTLAIPIEIYDSDRIKPSDFDLTGRMYEPKVEVGK